MLKQRKLIYQVLRALADTDNRGKLNLAEFHVAMGLIYRSKLIILWTPSHSLIFSFFRA